jgi:hypothetical protein
MSTSTKFLVFISQTSPIYAQLKKLITKPVSSIFNRYLAPSPFIMIPSNDANPPGECVCFKKQPKGATPFDCANVRVFLNISILLKICSHVNSIGGACIFIIASILSLADPSATLGPQVRNN